MGQAQKGRCAAYKGRCGVAWQQHLPLHRQQRQAQKTGKKNIPGSRTGKVVCRSVQRRQAVIMSGRQGGVEGRHNRPGEGMLGHKIWVKGRQVGPGVGRGKGWGTHTG